MFQNFWWPLEFSHAVTAKPKRVTALCQQFALYRTPDGKAVVMSDLCVHRGGSLADGWLAKDCIVCPYHGWQYDSAGACVRIPANHAGVPVPKKARVDSYPTQEKYGFVWAFLGDLPEAERPPLPNLPTADETDLKPITGEFKWNAHYERVVENGLDIAHAPFVHGSTFGNPEKPEVQDFTIEPIGDWGASATVMLEAPKPGGLWGWFMSKDRPPVKATTAFVMPCITVLEVNLTIGKMVLWDANIPVDTKTTLTKWISRRSFFKGDWADGNARKRVHKIFLQDQPIVEGQRPELVPFDIGAELSVKSDALQIAYRKMRNKAIDNGWSLDRDRVDLEQRRQGAVVIPSPARREIPELAKAWVHRPVPTRDESSD